MIVEFAEASFVNVESGRVSLGKFRTNFGDWMRDNKNVPESLVNRMPKSWFNKYDRTHRPQIIEALKRSNYMLNDCGSAGVYINGVVFKKPIDKPSQITESPETIPIENQKLQEASKLNTDHTKAQKRNEDLTKEKDEVTVKFQGLLEISRRVFDINKKQSGMLKKYKEVIISQSQKILELEKHLKEGESFDHEFIEFV
jgi:hypothetical protein